LAEPFELLNSVSETMKAVRTKNTEPELLVRRLIHGSGFRYRIHDSKIPGKPSSGAYGGP